MARCGVIFLQHIGNTKAFSEHDLFGGGKKILKEGLRNRGRGKTMALIKV
jgi:hypothetical protein